MKPDSEAISGSSEDIVQSINPNPESVRFQPADAVAGAEMRGFKKRRVGILWNSEKGMFSVAQAIDIILKLV
jgi:hypothetical protein